MTRADKVWSLALDLLGFGHVVEAVEQDTQAIAGEPAPAAMMTDFTASH